MPADPNNTASLCELLSASVKIDRRGIWVAGEEDEWRRRERTAYRQVLWCPPIAAADLAVSRDPSPLDDEGATIRTADGLTYGTAGKRAN